MTSYEILPSQASLAMCVLAISNGVGRLLSGFSTKYPDYACVVQGTCCINAMVCLFLLPHCSSAIHFYIATGLYGLNIAPLLVLNTTAMVNIVGMNALSTAYGISETIYGFGCIVGPILIGIAHEFFDNYVIPFYLGGACFALASAFSFITSKVHFGQKILSSPLK